MVWLSDGLLSLGRLCLSLSRNDWMNCVLGISLKLFEILPPIFLKMLFSYPTHQNSR